MPSVAELHETSGGIGSSVPRVEDDYLLRGRGEFIDNINLSGQLHVAFVRSPFPNAIVRSVDKSALGSEEGVVDILTGADMEAAGVGVLHSPTALTGTDGSPAKNPKTRALTTRPRFVGEAVALVVATTRDTAERLASEIDIDYEELAAVTDPMAALRDDAPRVFEEFDANLCLDWSLGDADAMDRVMTSAAHIAQVEVTNNRVVVAALETRGVVARYNEADQRYEVWTPTQGGAQVQAALASPGLNVDPSRVRVVTPDVGGGFGIKNGIHPEQIAVAWAARVTGRPLKWYASRSDSFLSDFHARDHRMRGELAIDVNGQFLGLRVDVVSNMGGCLSGAAPIIPTAGGTRMLANVYRIPAVAARTRCVFTNTAPIAAYRGAGKPEFAHLVEALVDEAARVTGTEPAEIRRRNLIQPSDFPYTTPTGLVYDSGEFERQLDLATEAAGPRPLPAASSELIGRGVVLYTEPDGFLDNRAQMRFDSSGRLTVITSAQTNGQGHYSTYTQIAASLLGMEPDRISVVEGDTDRTGFGSGSGGSRSTTVTGAAMHACSIELISKGRILGASLLEASVDDVEFVDGQFSISGTDRSVSWPDVARLAHNFGALPVDVAPGLEAQNHYKAPVYCYPSGCHVCDVAVDRDTGQVRVLRYLNVSDIGVLINPMMVEGQLHGGVAQGVGQVLQEDTIYDRQTGQLLSGSFMDYCMPRATDLPNIETAFVTTRCETNPLGVKGVGESGTTAALPAASAAVLDALHDFDTRGLRMPYTPQRVWRTIQGLGSDDEPWVA